MTKRSPRPIGNSEEPLLPRQSSAEETGVVAEGADTADSSTAFGSYFYWSHFLIGLTVLTPWNVLIGAVDYFKEVYPKYDAVRWVTMSFVVSQMITSIFLSFIPAKNRGHGRITMGYAALTIFMAFIATIDLIFNQGSEGKDEMFAMIIIISSLNGIFTAILEGSVTGVVSYAPAHIYKVYVRGFGVATVLSSAIRMILKASFTETANSLRYSACGFFYLASFSCLASLVAHRLYIVSNPIYNMSFQTLNQEQGLVDESAEREHKERPFAIQEWIAVAKIIKHPCLIFFLTYMVTLTMFPGVPADAEFGRLGSWYEVLLAFIFSSADLLLRFVPGKWIKTRSERVILFAVTRLLLLPVFFLVVKYFSNPATMTALMLFNGGSTGYLMICGFGILQEKLYGRQNSFIGGNIVVLAFVSGCSTGSGTSVLWSYLMDHL